MRSWPIVLALLVVAATGGCGTAHEEDSRPAGASEAADLPTPAVDCPGCTARLSATYSRPDGREASATDLEKARQMVESRLRAVGYTDVPTLSGSTVSVTLAGTSGESVRDVFRAPHLGIRPVIAAVQPGAASPSTGAGTPPTPEGAAPTAAPAPQLPMAPAQASATDTDAVVAARAERQSTDPAVQQLAVRTLDCGQPDPLAGHDDPALPLVTCSQDGTEIFLLAPTRIDGAEISSATSQLGAQSRYEVTLEFTSGGADAWATLTQESFDQRLAFVLDTKVVSAPMVRSGPQLGGRTTIAGNFTRASGDALARDISTAAVTLTASATQIAVIRPSK